MFSTYAQTIKTYAHYTINTGTMHVYYDNDCEFGSSLDILTDPVKSNSNDETNNFVSLTFSFHYKTGPFRSVLFSLTKLGGETLALRLTNNTKFITLTISDANDLISSISCLTFDLMISRVKCTPYLTNDIEIQRCKNLLNNLNMLIKKLLDNPEPENIAANVVTKISSLLQLESAEFSTILDINSEDTFTCKP